MVDQVTPSLICPQKYQKQYVGTIWINFFEILENSQRSAEIKQTPNQEKNPSSKE